MIDIVEACGEEWAEWYRMTPQERWAESEKLWDTYQHAFHAIPSHRRKDSECRAASGAVESLERELRDEERREREADAEYWAPLKAELQRLRMRRRA
jgi:hypothetical protein